MCEAILYGDHSIMKSGQQKLETCSSLSQIYLLIGNVIFFLLNLKEALQGDEMDIVSGVLRINSCYRIILNKQELLPIRITDDASIGSMKPHLEMYKTDAVGTKLCCAMEGGWLAMVS